MRQTDAVFGTVLHDVFRDDERVDLHAALEGLCSPLDNYGWASVGIYAFFDPAGGLPPLSNAAEFPSHLANAGSRILYLGLARDLPQRLQQHTGLMPCPPQNCKSEQINEWFADHPTLGFSCFAQSPFAQVNTHRERGRFAKLDDEELKSGFWDNPPDGLDSAALLEGLMIESYRLIHGRLPPWNKVGGRNDGAERALGGSGDGLLLLMEAPYPTLFRARRTIRQLSNDISAAAFESCPLHVARMNALVEAYKDRAGTAQIISVMNRLLADPRFQEAGYRESVEAMLRAGYLDDVLLARGIRVPRP